MENDKELLIRIRADIRQSLAELKKVSAEIAKTGNESRASSRAVDGLGASTSRASRDMDGLVRAQQSATRSSHLLRDAIASIASAVGAAKIGSFVKDSVLLAADVQTLDVVMGVVGRNAGYTRGQMELFNEQVKAMGITSQVSARSVIRMTQAQLDLTKSSQLARVAQDAAVIGSTNSSEALDRLLHGITSLQPEILRNIGIMVNFEHEYVKFAKQTNRTVESLSANEKQQIALNAVLREGEKISGTYEAALDTAGKKLGSLERQATTASEELGKLFQPSFKLLVDQYSEAVNMLAEELRGMNAVLGTSGIENYSLERVDSEIARVQERLDELFAKDLNFVEFYLFEGSQFVNLDRQLTALLERRRQIQQESMKIGFIEGREPPPPAAKPDPAEEARRAAEEEAARAAAERVAKTREDAVRSLEFEAKTYGLTRQQIALYRLELEGASQAQIERARTALESIDAQEQSERAFNETVKQTMEALDEELSLMEEGRQLRDHVRTAQEQLNESLERYRLLLQGGAIDPETFKRASAKAEDDFKKIEESGDKSFKALTDAVHGWGKEFNDTLTDMVMAGKFQFGDLVDSMIRDLLRLSLYEGISKPLFDVFKSFLPTVNTGVAAASGGYISGPGTATSDSIPARLSNGEYVVRASAVRAYGASFLEAINQMRLPRFAHVPNLSITRPGHRFAEGGLAEPLGAGGGVGSLKVQIDNKGTQIRATEAQATFDPDGLVVRIVTEDVRRGGPMSGVLERTFGLRRKGGF